LLTEFYEDLFEENPDALLKAAKNADGEIVFDETGDPLIDKWEKELAQGITPDLTEGMSDEALASLEKEAGQTSNRNKDILLDFDSGKGLSSNSKSTTRDIRDLILGNRG